MNRYLHQPHAPDCDCSVCWSKREMAKPVTCPSTRCADCRPFLSFKLGGHMVLMMGAWVEVKAWYRYQPAFTCAKHTPSDRPPRYWHVVQDIGKPTPFVPIHEPFELTG